MPFKSRPDSKETGACKACGREFTYYKCQPRAYCSKECYHSTKAATHITTTCPTCGKEFTYSQAWPRRYCSNACKGKANITNIKHFQPSAYTTTCEQCGKEYVVDKPSSNKGRFCSLQCAGRWQAEHVKGEAHPNSGRKFGRNEKRYGPPITLACVVCGKEFSTKASHLDRRRCCSKECLATLQSQAFAGDNNPNWRGGYMPYYGPSWPNARRLVRQRDNYTCQDCGITEAELGQELDVHHLDRFGNYGPEHHEEANRLDNLVSLCKACHTRRENAIQL